MFIELFNNKSLTPAPEMGYFFRPRHNSRLKIPPPFGSSCFPAQAFSLIELLSALAILAVLAALVFPRVSDLREAARASKCMANLRQVHMALASYAQDHDGYLPEIGDAAEHTYWYKDIVPYYSDLEPTVADLLKAPPIQVCETQKQKARAFGTKYLGFTYGMNAFLSPNHQKDKRSTVRRQKLSQIPLPATTLLATEAGFTAQSCVAAIDHYWLAQGATENGVYKKGAHRGANNVLWCDGHVSQFPDVKQMIPPGPWFGGPNDKYFAPGGLQWQN